MTPEVYQRNDNLYGWRLTAANGEIVTSSKGYPTQAAARVGASRMQTVALSATSPGVKVAAGKPSFHILPSNNGQWFWRLIDGDGVTNIAHGETYTTKQGADRGVQDFVKNVLLAVIKEMAWGRKP